MKTLVDFQVTANHIMGINLPDYISITKLLCTSISVNIIFHINIRKFFLSVV